MLIPRYNPNFRIQPQFPQSDHTPQKRPISVEICVEIFGEIFFGHPEHWVKGVFEKKRHPIWSTFAPVAPFTICNPIYGLPTLYYISQPRPQMKYSAAMYYPWPGPPLPILDQTIVQMDDGGPLRWVEAISKAAANREK